MDEKLLVFETCHEKTCFYIGEGQRHRLVTGQLISTLVLAA